MSFWVSVWTPSRCALAWAALNLTSVFCATLGAGKRLPSSRASCADRRDGRMPFASRNKPWAARLESL